MKHSKKSSRNLMVVEADRDLVRIIHAHAKKHHLKSYGLVSELLRIGLKMKRLLPSQTQEAKPPTHLQA